MHLRGIPKEYQPQTKPQTMLWTTALDCAANHFINIMQNTLLQTVYSPRPGSPGLRTGASPQSSSGGPAEKHMQHGGASFAGRPSRFLRAPPAPPSQKSDLPRKDGLLGTKLHTLTVSPRTVRVAPSPLAVFATSRQNIKTCAWNA